MVSFSLCYQMILCYWITDNLFLSESRIKRQIKRQSGLVFLVVFQTEFLTKRDFHFYASKPSIRPFFIWNFTSKSIKHRKNFLNLVQSGIRETLAKLQIKIVQKSSFFISVHSTYNWKNKGKMTTCCINYTCTCRYIYDICFMLHVGVIPFH